ncbi:TlpA disulfide reductase family protein [Sphingobium sp. H39-3-25]|uniref:TlpA disulfide reductase family protein n=1 Tax=Sphingobium arseniciresistens TaxID=3030834 RepID=UPI0023B9DBB7|nr:TlpA disulfide reductase family protein [Sphingobium arseniciresistens]
MMSLVTRRAFNSLALTTLLLNRATGAIATEPTGQLDIGAYRGRILYLDFWASWCGPCRLSFPFMAGLTQRYSPRDLAVVTVNLDRSRAQADSFLARIGGGLPVVYDNAGALAHSYRISDMPTSILFDRQGRARFTHKGFHPDQTATYVGHIDQLVRER